jgi:hypothetical protein
LRRIIVPVRALISVGLLVALFAILVKTILTHDALGPYEQAATISAVGILMLGMVLVSGVRAFRQR